MKGLGQIYHDSFYGGNKWYHIVWFYVAMGAIFIALAPGGIWRRITQPEMFREIKRKRAEYLKAQKNG